MYGGTGIHSLVVSLSHFHCLFLCVCLSSISLFIIPAFLSFPLSLPLLPLPFLFFLSSPPPPPHIPPSSPASLFSTARLPLFLLEYTTLLVLFFPFFLLLLAYPPTSFSFLTPYSPISNLAQLLHFLAATYSYIRTERLTLLATPELYVLPPVHCSQAHTHAHALINNALNKQTNKQGQPNQPRHTLTL